MIRVGCRCGMQFEVGDEFAGRRGSCPRCGGPLIIGQAGQRIGAPLGTQLAPGPKTKRARECPQCGAVVPSLTFSCAYCGAPVPREEPDSPPNVRASVVEERPRGVLGKLTQSMDPLRHLRDECQDVPDSPEELVTFFSRHIGGLDDFQIPISALHAQACEGALTKLRAFARHDAPLSATVADLERQLLAKQRQRRRRRYALFVGAPAAFFLLLVIIAIAGVIGTSHNSAIRSDIQRMVKEGRFDEARIRAEAISGTDEIKRTLESIDKAERARGQRSPLRDDFRRGRHQAEGSDAEVGLPAGR
jgi:hypothetical protein